MTKAKIDRICLYCEATFKLNQNGAGIKFCCEEHRKKSSRKRHSEKSKNDIRNYYYIKKYGITEKDKDEIFKSQKYKCAICKRKETNPRSIHLDHCHTTGKIRGVLCGPCNQAIGMFNDSPKILRSAIRYLNK